MDEDWYVVDKMIRSRVAEAQARARWAALRFEVTEREREMRGTA
jgi:hypothetical protein